MLTRLLACLALVTGLAAIGTPANAAVAQTLRTEISGRAVETQPGKAQPCAVVARQRALPATKGDDAACRRYQPITIYIPTVQFGPDRAFE